MPNPKSLPSQRRSDTLLAAVCTLGVTNGPGSQMVWGPNGQRAKMVWGTNDLGPKGPQAQMVPGPKEWSWPTLKNTVLLGNGPSPKSRFGGPPPREMDCKGTKSFLGELVFPQGRGPRQNQVFNRCSMLSGIVGTPHRRISRIIGSLLVLCNPICPLALLFLHLQYMFLICFGFHAPENFRGAHHISQNSGVSKAVSETGWSNNPASFGARHKGKYIWHSQLIKWVGAAKGTQRADRATKGQQERAAQAPSPNSIFLQGFGAE